MELIISGKTRESMVLRLVAAAASFSAAITMLTNKDTVSLPNYSFQIQYLYFQAYLYFVIANLIAAIYSILVLFLPTNSLLWHTAVAVDAVICMVLSAANSAAMTILLLGRRGNQYTNWSPICNSVPNFCIHAIVSVAVSLLGLLCYLVLFLYSIQNIINPFLVEEA